MSFSNRWTLAIVLLTVAVMRAATQLDQQGQEVTDRQMMQGDVEADVEAVGGTMKFSKEGGEGGNGNSMELKIISLEEVDMNGNKIANVDHYIDSFSDKEFESKNQTDSEMIGGMSMSSQNFTTEIQDGNFMMMMKMCDDDGDMTIGNDKVPMNSGDMKIDFQIDGWEFCDECNDTSGRTVNGSYVDLVIEIVGQSQAATGKSGSNTQYYDIGGDMQVIFPDYVTIDGVDIDLPDGFPELIPGVNGEGDKFVIRIPKFTVSAYYDPLISTSGCVRVVTNIISVMMLFGLAKLVV